MHTPAIDPAQHRERIALSGTKASHRPGLRLGAHRECPAAGRPSCLSDARRQGAGTCPALVTLSPASSRQVPRLPLQRLHGRQRVMLENA